MINIRNARIRTLGRFVVTAMAVVTWGLPALARDESTTRMSAANLRMRPGTTASLNIRGMIDGDATFGWTVMVRLEPREGARGKLFFTPAPPAPAGDPVVSVRQIPAGQASIRVIDRRSPEVDIGPRDDAWPGEGSFSAFDTSETGSVFLNGAVDDNGRMVAEPVTFDGVLAAFPIQATGGAEGTWDVILDTPSGSSSWEGVPTQLVRGTVTVTTDRCIASAACDDGDPCTTDSCVGGECTHRADAGACPQRGRGGHRKGEDQQGDQ